MQQAADLQRNIGRPRDSRASSAILVAARRQLNELGYARMSMESVASEAQVSRATLYRRYRDKADLVTSAIALVALDYPDPLPGDSRAAVTTFLERLEERLGGECFEVLAALIAAREDRRAIALHRERTIAPRWSYLLGLLAQARDEGELAADADLELAAQMLIGSVFARLINGTQSSAGWAHAATEAIWVGMAAKAAPGLGMYR